MPYPSMSMVFTLLKPNITGDDYAKPKHLVDIPIQMDLEAVAGSSFTTQSAINCQPAAD